MYDRMLYGYVRSRLALRALRGLLDERGEGSAAFLIALGVALTILLPLMGLVLSGGIGGAASRLKAFLDALSFSTGP